MNFDRISILLSGAEVAEIQTGASQDYSEWTTPWGSLLIIRGTTGRYHYADPDGWFLITPTFHRQLISIESRWPGAARTIAHQLDSTPFDVAYTDLAWECFAHWRVDTFSPNRGEKTKHRGPAAPDIDLSDLKA